MKCANNCRCGRHHRHDPRQLRGYNNTTTNPERLHYSSTYGEQQRRRIAQATQARHAAGISWRDTPSDRFDWDNAIARFHILLKEVYGE
jgi:hypothetical protein